MCLISLITPRKKPSKKTPSKSAASGQESRSQPAARITNNATTSQSHTVEFPISHLPPYLSQRAPSTTPTIQITPPATEAPSPYQYVDPATLYTTTTTAIPAWSAPNCASPGDRTHRNARRASVLSEIDFVQTLSSKLAPPAPSPKGPSETEKKMQAEIQRMGEIMQKRERDEEIAAAVARGKAEALKKEKDAEAQKSQQQKSSCRAESCGCCSGKSDSRTAVGQDGFVFHLHTHQNDNPLGIGAVMSNGGPSNVDESACGLYDRRRSSAGDMAMGCARRMMDRVRRIETRTALLETEMEMGWERDLDRERRRYWGRERERDRYPGSTWGRGYF